MCLRVELGRCRSATAYCLTGDQLVRLAPRAQSGQTVLVTGALGSVGRAAVHAAKKLGVKVIAGVRARQLAEARTLGVSDTVAIDDDAAIAELAPVDGVADTVGGETAAKLFGKVKNGGIFGYASVLPEGVAATQSDRHRHSCVGAGRCGESPRVCRGLS